MHIRHAAIHEINVLRINIPYHQCVYLFGFYGTKYLIEGNHTYKAMGELGVVIVRPADIFRVIKHQ